MPKRKWTRQEIQEYRKANGSLVYFNKEDSNFIIPKTYGFGFTFNWAHPLSWAAAALVLAFIIYSAVKGI
jgi:uncharacterized membrane protein